MKKLQLTIIAFLLISIVKAQYSGDDNNNGKKISRQQGICWW